MNSKQDRAPKAQLIESSSPIWIRLAAAATVIRKFWLWLEVRESKEEENETENRGESIEQVRAGAKRLDNK